MKKTQRKTQLGFCKQFLVLLFLCFSTLTYAQGQGKTVSGMVKDEFNEPMIGVGVLIKGTTQGTRTDAKGAFTLQNVLPENTLVFSSMTFVTQELKVGGKEAFQVVMREDAKLLEEVIVIGFQSQKKINMTSAVSRVGSEMLENRPVANVGQALQGVVPNLNIGITDGAPNTVPSFNIRGGTTMDKDGKMISGSPLILLDGVEVSATALNQLNPNDIDDISVLKDASAAAVYGTKATFGVILVQTKTGGYNQRAKINYSFDMSWDQPMGYPDLPSSFDHQNRLYQGQLWRRDVKELTNDQLLELRYLEEYQNNPQTSKMWYPTGGWREGMTDDMILNGGANWVGNYNPYKEVVKEWTPTMKHSVSISGGTDKINYYVSLGYMNQDGFYKIATDKFKRYNGMVNLNAKITSWMNLGAKVTYNHTKYTHPSGMPGTGNLWATMKSKALNTRMPLLAPEGSPLPGAFTEHHASYLYSDARTVAKREHAIYTISPEFIIIPKELKVKVDFSLSPTVYRRTKIQPEMERIEGSWVTTTKLYTEMNKGEVEKTNDDKYALNAYIDYHKVFFKDHDFSALLGYNQERSKNGGNIMYLNGLFYPNILNPNMVNDRAENYFTNTGTVVTSRAVFMRFMYNYQGKYMAQFDARYDGSSKFSKDERYMIFPTFSLGWRLSEEKFMNFSKRWMDSFKFRYSWGTLGSQPGDAYPYLSVLKGDKSKFIFDGRTPSIIKAPELVTPGLKWAKATTSDFGIEAVFLKNRLSAEFDAYSRTTKDILITGAKAYSALLGAKAPLENTGEIRAKGWEISLGWKDRLSNGLSYNLGFTLADSKTKIVSYSGNSDYLFRMPGGGETYPNAGDAANGQVSPYSGKYDGEIWGYETGGILQLEDFDSYDEATNTYIYSGAKHMNEKLYPGYLWYKDLNGDGIISGGNNTLLNPGDKRIIGNTTPRYQYGITAGASWKGFDLSLFFRGVGKRDAWIDRNSSYWGRGAGSQDMLNASWTPDNLNAKYPMYAVGDLNTRPQTGYIVDASYFSLKQAVVGYTLPKNLLGKFGVDVFRVNFSVYNVFTITDVPNWFEPENISDSYPAKRTLAIGAQLTF